MFFPPLFHSHKIPIKLIFQLLSTLVFQSVYATYICRARTESSKLLVQTLGFQQLHAKFLDHYTSQPERIPTF